MKNNRSHFIFENAPLHTISLHHIAPFTRTAPHRTAPHRTAPHRIAPHRTTPVTNSPPPPRFHHPAVTQTCGRCITIFLIQKVQSELIRKQQDFLNRSNQRSYPRSQDTRPQRTRSSRSRSPVRRSDNYRRHSRSPDMGRRSSFQPSTSGQFRQDKLLACPICLGRHRHCQGNLASCTQ